MIAVTGATVHDQRPLVSGEVRGVHFHAVTAVTGCIGMVNVSGAWLTGGLVKLQVGKSCRRRRGAKTASFPPLCKILKVYMPFWAQNVNMVAQRKIKWLSWNDGHWCCLLEKGVLVWSSRTSPCRTKLKRATEVAVGDDWTCELPKRLQLGHSNQS